MVYNKPTIQNSPNIYNFGGGGGGGGLGDDYLDIDGKIYRVVQIDNLLWLGENLDFKFDTLNIGITPGQYDLANPRAGYYNNNENAYGYNGAKWGLMYNRKAVDYIKNNNLLPSGWRIPTKSDFTNLSSNHSRNSCCSAIGWNTPGTNETGFNSLACGYYQGSFYDPKIETRFWINEQDWAEYLSNSSFSNITDYAGSCYYLRICKNA